MSTANGYDNPKERIKQLEVRLAEADERESLPLSPAPCDCYELIDGFYVNRCDCGNSGDYGAMEVWCHEMNKSHT